MKVWFTALRAIVYSAAFISLWGWIALGVRVYDDRFPAVLPTWTDIPGIFLMAFGGGLALTCVGVFVLRGTGTPAPFDAPRLFVAAGPYRYVRNPMYIGGWIALIGLGFFEQSLSIILFSFPWLLLAHLFVLTVEERSLEARFGSSYLDYKKSTNRWLPRWR